MQKIYSTEELFDLLSASRLECNSASPFRALMSINRDAARKELSYEEKLVAAFALQPERVTVWGRHSAADGDVYVLSVQGAYAFYTRIYAGDRHLFRFVTDKSGAAKFLKKNFTDFILAQSSGALPLSVSLTDQQAVALELIRALYASRAAKKLPMNDPFTASDLRDADLELYLKNYLDELSFYETSARVSALSADAEKTETVLAELTEKGLLAPALSGDTNAWSFTRSAVDNVDSGLSVDTLRRADLTDPARPTEIIFELRRNGVLAMIPTKDGGLALKTYSAVPFEELL